MFGSLRGRSTEMVTPDQSLPGRADKMTVPSTHLVLGTPLEPPFPDPWAELYVGMGCFWGAERAMWEQEGVITTAVGYMGGWTPNPTYEEVCTGRTGHAEVVRVVFDPTKVSLEVLVRRFFEEHDPTQAMRQGNDIGTQYRSALYLTSDQDVLTATSIANRYALELKANGFGSITTEIARAREFYYAEDYHQQYLRANPNGYCGIGGTGVSCPVGLSVPTSSN